MGKKRILVVDDELDILLAVTRWLIRHGYDVSAMDNADKALKYLRDGGACDLIVLDLMMPGMPGLLFLRMLRNDERSQVPVILLTAKATLHDVASGYNKGAEFYITKPCEPETLRMAVDYLIGDWPIETLTRLEAELLVSENVYYGSSRTMYR